MTSGSFCRLGQLITPVMSNSTPVLIPIGLEHTIVSVKLRESLAGQLPGNKANGDKGSQPAGDGETDDSALGNPRASCTVLGRGG